MFLMFPHDQIQVVLVNQRNAGSFTVLPTRRRKICFGAYIDDVGFDHWVTVTAASFLQCQVTISSIVVNK